MASQFPGAVGNTQKASAVGGYTTYGDVESDGDTSTFRAVGYSDTTRSIPVQVPELTADGVRVYLEATSSIDTFNLQALPRDTDSSNQTLTTTYPGDNQFVEYTHATMLIDNYDFTIRANTNDSGDLRIKEVQPHYVPVGTHDHSV